MKFSQLYEELKFDDVFSKASSEEVEKRTKQYAEMRMQTAVDKIKDKTKLPDGSWHIHGDLNLHACGLKTLKELNVSIVDQDFQGCCNFLTDLIGSPKKVGRDFDVSNNLLTSLEGAPKEVSRSFYCSKNEKQFTEEEVKAICDVKGKIYV